MPLKLNGKKIDKVYLGQTKIGKIGLGSTDIYNGTPNYFCITCNDPNNPNQFGIRKYGTPMGIDFWYSTNQGKTWTELIPGVTILTMYYHQSVWIKGNNLLGINKDENNYNRFIMAGNFALSGNIMSLIDNGACRLTTIPNNYCFYKLFADEVDHYGGLRDLSKLQMPATTLTDYCYAYMFYESNVQVCPQELPATTLANYCYQSMFSNCDALTSAPTLSATTLATGAYSSMFYDCFALNIAPALPATVLAPYCYYQMFSGSNIFISPILSATTLAEGCYEQMFANCTNLDTLPKLPTTGTLPNRCYYEMFSNCASLWIFGSSGTSWSHAWRIPTSGTAMLGTDSAMAMLWATMGDYGETWGNAPLNRTVYTQNAPV